MAENKKGFVLYADQMYKIIFVLTLAFQMPLGRGYDKQEFFILRLWM